MTITADELRKLLSYNRRTGQFRWRESRGGHLAGSVAGYADPSGRVWIRIKGRLYAASRLVWLHVHGTWPKRIADHKNRNPGDNRLTNLREATQAENLWNRPQQVNNTTGVKGVHFDKANNLYRARITVRGKDICLGRHKSKGAAAAAYAKAAAEHHGAFACPAVTQEGKSP